MLTLRLGVDLGTYGKVDLRTFCGLSVFFCGLNDYVIVLSLPSLYYSFYLFLTDCSIALE